MESTHEQNKAIVREFLELAVNRREPEQAVADHVASGFRLHDEHGIRDEEHLIAQIHGITTAYPALRFEVTDQVAQGDLVITHGLLKRSASDAGVPATNVFRLADGRIVEHWGCTRELATAAPAEAEAAEPAPTRRPSIARSYASGYGMPGRIR